MVPLYPKLPIRISQHQDTSLAHRSPTLCCSPRRLTTPLPLRDTPSRRAGTVEAVSSETTEGTFTSPSGYKRFKSSCSLPFISPVTTVLREGSRLRTAQQGPSQSGARGCSRETLHRVSAKEVDDDTNAVRGSQVTEVRQWKPATQEVAGQRPEVCIKK